MEGINRRTQRFSEEERLSRRHRVDEGDVGPYFAEGIETPPLLWETITRMKEALEQAIADAESAETVTYRAFDGQLVSITAGRYTYQFTLKTYWDVQENAKVYVIDNQGQKRDARVVSRVAMTIIIAAREELPDESMAGVTLVEDTVWLLRRQLQAVTNLQETAGQFGAKTLGLSPVQSDVTAVRGKLGAFEPNQAQLRAIGHGLASERTLIIGPGGTGKTATISDLTCRYLRQGLSVLLVSHTNIATDNAFIRLIKAMLSSRKADLRDLVEQGLVVRQGDPRHIALLKGEYRGLTVAALAEARIGEQAQVRERLQKESEGLGRKVEELERDLQRREQAWQMQRNELLQKITPLAEHLKSLRAEQEEHERKEKAFFETKAGERVEVLKVLEPLRNQYQQLIEARDHWVAEQQRRKQNWEHVQNELGRARKMGRLERFFSEYRDYDFEAAERNVARLLSEKGRAEQQVTAIDSYLQENQQARREPEAALYKIDFEEQGIRNLKASSVVDTRAWRIKRLEQQLAPLQEKLDKGEASIVILTERVKELRSERARIEGRLEELKAEQESLRAHIVADAQLVATTITGVYVNPLLLSREYDVVVVDELSMISVISVLLVASRAISRFVGSGDPMQLPPVLKLEHPEQAPLAQEWLGRNLFTHLGVTIFDAIKGEKDCVLLDCQGRMHPVIAAPINHLVYQGMLTNREETKNFPTRDPYPEWPLMLVDSSQSEARAEKESKKRPRHNRVHAEIAVALVWQALASLPRQEPCDDPAVPRVAVIAPYRSQVNLISQKLREAGLMRDVHVGTINTVQSLEFEVVILDTVEAPGLPPFSFTCDRILDEHNMATEATCRLNVAHTRARYKLIYIAHLDHLLKYQPRNPNNDPGKRCLIVELVKWAGREGSVSAVQILKTDPSGGEG